MRVRITNVDIGWMVDGKRRVDTICFENGVLVVDNGTADFQFHGDGLVLAKSFHDHHVHLRGLVASAISLDLGPRTAPSGVKFDSLLRDAVQLRRRGEWIRATGFHEQFVGEVTCGRLDRLAPRNPVRVEHASGALWVLNTLAISELLACGMPDSLIERDEQGNPSGHFLRAESWLRALPPLGGLDCGLSEKWLAHGITGFTDATVGRDELGLKTFDAWLSEMDMQQEVLAMNEVDHHIELSNCTSGPVKILLDDTDLPPIEDLAARISSIHLRGSGVAIHCVTQIQAVVALSALEQARPHRLDRIEHGSVLDSSLISWLARLGVAVVTQPGFIVERGDRYVRDVGLEEASRWWPVASLLKAGIPVALSSDAPYAELCPTATIRAATTRTTRTGLALGIDECIKPWVAASLMVRDVLPGSSRDHARQGWCLLEIDEELIPERVAWTSVGNRATDLDGNSFS